MVTSHLNGDTSLWQGDRACMCGGGLGRGGVGGEG